MNQINRIEFEHIKRLKPEQLVRLLHILLHAEARNRLLSEHGIHVPFQITVADGGRDGKWEGDIEKYEYIPKKLTIYQSKAQSMTKSAFRKEILKTDKPNKIKLKEEVQNVLDLGGAYVIFCSHPIVKLDEMVRACRKALKDAGRKGSEKDCIAVLDANRISDWVNRHVSALAYVSELTMNFQTVAIKNVAAWGQDVNVQYEFQLNDYLAGHILSLRKCLIKPKNVARITGSSGLGKSRLGYEVFNCKTLGNDGLREALSGSTGYVDAQTYGSLVLGWVDQLCAFGFAGVIVVDNCPFEWHHQLAAAVQRPVSRLSLLTLDYVPESTKAGILHIELNPNNLRDIVPKILRSVPELKHLEDSDLERVAGFAQGFPQIAILTAKAGKALEIQHLNDQNKLADKLLWGRTTPDVKAREYIQSLALFSYVGAMGSAKKQLDFVRKKLCNDVSEFDFNKAIQPFIDKRIIQMAGDYILVAPPPLAVALASEWLTYAPDTLVLELLPGIAECELTKSFCEQLEKLDFSDRAAALSKKLLGAGSPLSLAEVLDSEVGSQIFRALAELNPLAASECLTRVFAHFSPAQFKAIENGRRNLIWALEKLCWSPETFPQAAKILLAFAAGENESYGNNATQQFQQLFHVFLSGTKSAPALRLEVARYGLSSKYEEQQRVCVHALGAALQHGHFTRSSGPEIRGTQLPEKDWEPKNYEEIWGYWKEVFNLLKGLIYSESELSKLAIDMIGKRTAAFLGNHLLFDLENDFQKIAVKCNGYWPEAREQIVNFLSYQKKLPDNAKMAINRWLSYVQPKDLKSRLMEIVSLPTWEHNEVEKGKFIDVAAHKAENFAEELIQNNIPWEEYIPMLLQGEQRQAWFFGAKCAQLVNDPKALIKKCFKALRSIDKNNQNPQLIRGILSAVNDRSLVTDILEMTARDDALVHLLCQFTTAVRPTVFDFDRIIIQIFSGRLEPSCIQIFAYGSVTVNFDDVTFNEKLQYLLNNVPSAASAILSIINMHCHLKPNKITVFNSLLEKLLLLPEILKISGDNMIGHYWQENIIALLSGSPKQEWVANLTHALIKNIEDYGPIYWSADRTYQVIALLLEKHTNISWPIFCNALKKFEGQNSYYLIKLLTHKKTGFDNHGSPIWALPTAKLEIWAKKNPQQVPKLLHFMSLFISKKNEAGQEEFIWHPHALMLFQYGKINEIIGCIHANLASFGSSGSRMPYLEKRIKLLKTLRSYKDERLIRIEESLTGLFEEAMQSAKKIDEQHAVGIY